MWNKDKVDCIDSLVGETMISCLLSNNVNGAEWYFSGVHCKGNEIERAALWQELSMKLCIVLNGRWAKEAKSNSDRLFCVGTTICSLISLKFMLYPRIN